MLYSQITLSYLCPKVLTIFIRHKIRQIAVKGGEPGYGTQNYKSKRFLGTFLTAA